MKTFGATLGALALNFLLIALMLLIVGTTLWLIVPVAFPAVTFTWLNGIGVAGLLYIVKAIYI